MGGGLYSSTDASFRSVEKGYDTKSTFEVFKETNINNAMNPYGVTIRESRDSEEHPNSVAIILGLDVTGSMGSVPHFLIKKGLIDIMDHIIQNGIYDPQVMFVAVGDHECDHSPLQVGQFESSDELLDHWLEKVYLEGGGGGNDGESYMLTWYFAGYHTSIDCMEKRNQKGFLFTIGDEPVLKSISRNEIKKIMGDGQYSTSYSSSELLDKAREKYHCVHIHIKETNSGSRQLVIDGWKQLMGDNLIVANHKEDVSKLIYEFIINHNQKSSHSDKKTNISNTNEEMML